MKRQFAGFKRLVIAVVFVAALTSFNADGSEGQTNTAPAEIRKSIFNDDPKSGRDPFFPNSTRRAERTPLAEEPLVAPIVQLSLKGISGPAGRRFALINNQPLAPGESAMVRVTGGQVKVHCWEIRESSVVISIAGDPERKELHLREGL